MTGPPPPGHSPQPGVKGFSPRLGTIGPYKILELLGQGGMAAVYLARDERNGEEVAVKVLSRLRPTWVQRFAREFDAARRVEHPNVVRVLEAGESEGLAYYSMERIEGVTAARYVLDLAATDPLPPQPPVEHRGPPLPLRSQLIQRTLDVAIQLCGAVGAIHQVGLVHRDLKPGNVLVDGDGLLKPWQLAALLVPCGACVGACRCAREHRDETCVCAGTVYYGTGAAATLAELLEQPHNVRDAY